VKRTLMLLGWLAIGLAASAQEQRAQEHEGASGNDYTKRVMIWSSAGRGFLGVHLTPLTPELRAHFGVPEDTGVMVARVEEGGPAEAAGIRVGDILSSIDGERVDSSGQIARAVRAKEEGDLVNVELYRNGSLQSYTVTVGERDRRVIDLAEGYRFIPNPGELPDHDIVIRAPGLPLDEQSMEAFEEAMRGLEEHFDSPEWQERIERFNELDFSAIEERMEEVERRLKELEEDLDKEEKEKL